MRCAKRVARALRDSDTEQTFARRPAGPASSARRRILSAAAGTAVLGAGCAQPVAASRRNSRSGFFIALSGPASLFGPTQRACAELAAEKINKAGGIMGRPVKLIFTDAGGRRPRPPSRPCA